MRAVVQRVSSASVAVGTETVSTIGPGLLVLLGVGRGDGEREVAWLAEKVVGLRIFEDGAGKMNRGLLETGGELLVVSQFTLYGDVRKGKRPSFVGAMEPSRAAELYGAFCEACATLGARVSRGVFRAEMRVALVNEGPVTLILQTEAGPMA